MTHPDPLTVDQVVATVERELAGTPSTRPSLQGSPLAAARELQRAFRSDPLGGRLLPVKRLLHWFVASSFDRQAKSVEALLDALDAEYAERERLARRLAELEARLAALEPARPVRS